MPGLVQEFTLRAFYSWEKRSSSGKAQDCSKQSECSLGISLSVNNLKDLKVALQKKREELRDDT